MIKMKMIKWNNNHVIESINLFEKNQKIKWFNHLIWSIDFYFITSLFHSLCMNDLITNRICLFEPIRIVIFSLICWFRIESFYYYSIEMIFSYLLIFEIVDKSMSTKINMQFWWNQIEVTKKLEDDLIRRKNLRDEQRSRFSEKSRWIKKWEISR